MTSRAVVHRFLREPNLQSNIGNRVANRFDPFRNTLTVLDDPNRNRKLFLIGTTNSSTTLAYRTKLLMQGTRPDNLYVQTCSKWWDYAKHVDVGSQAQFAEVSKAFRGESYKFENNPRGIMFRLRYYSWIWGMRAIAKFPTDFNMFNPGLQTYFALKAAGQTGANVAFAGNEIDEESMKALLYQPDMYMLKPLLGLNQFAQLNSSWSNNYDDFYSILQARGGQAFAESMDRSRINFMVQVFKKLAPKQKAILVDRRDERIFNDLYRMEGNTVAVVNQWHMQGVETHWRRATGTEVSEEDLSPIADMDIDAYQETDLRNEYLRNRASKLGNTEPATSLNYLTLYHKVYEVERSRHTHHHSHQDIPEPGEEPKH